MMKKITKRVAAVAAMSAAIAVPVAGLTAATAGAVPREPNCIAIKQAMSDSADMAQAAYSQGDERGGDSWMDIYWRASSNADRYCH
jgi:hypothetical protein